MEPPLSLKALYLIAEKPRRNRIIQPGMSLKRRKKMACLPDRSVGIWGTAMWGLSGPLLLLVGGASEAPLEAQLAENLPAMQQVPAQFPGWEVPPEKGQAAYPSILGFAWWLRQATENLPTMWETWVRSLGWDDPPEEGMATHPGILAWRIPEDRGACWAIVHGVTKSWAWLSD